MIHLSPLAVQYADTEIKAQNKRMHVNLWTNNREKNYIHNQGYISSAHFNHQAKHRLAWTAVTQAKFKTKSCIHLLNENSFSSLNSFVNLHVAICVNVEWYLSSSTGLSAWEEEKEDIGSSDSGCQGDNPSTGSSEGNVFVNDVTSSSGPAHPGGRTAAVSRSQSLQYPAPSHNQR